LTVTLSLVIASCEGIEGDRAQIHPDHPVNEGDEEDQARPFGFDQPAQPEHHPPLIFLRDLDRRAE
jgi:hypothetical protein